MKTKFWVLLLAAVLAVCAGLSVLLLLPGSPAAYARITSRGTVVEIVDLSRDQEFLVEDSAGCNTVTVRDGKIAVTQADCPDQYCVHRGFCNSGTPIVCLPHQLVIEFLADQGVDGIVG